MDFAMKMFRNIIIIFLLLLVSLFFLEIYAKKNNLKSRYYKELLSDLKTLEQKNDPIWSTAVKELSKKLILKKDEEFIFCIKNGGLFMKSCIWDDQPFDFKKKYTFSKSMLESYFNELVYRVPQNYKDNKLKINPSPKDNITAWRRENDITAERKAYKISDIKQFYQPIVEKISEDNKGLKVLILTDSFGAGNGLTNIEDSWPRILEKKLNQKGDFEVYLVSQHGANYKNFDIWMRSGVLDKIKPDIIILSFFENDFYFYDFMDYKRNFEFAEVIDPSTINFISCLNDKNIIDKLLFYFKNLSEMIKYYKCDQNKKTKQDNANIIINDVVDTYTKFNELTSVPIFFFELDNNMSVSVKKIKNKLIEKEFIFFDLEFIAENLYKDFCNLHGELGTKLNYNKMYKDCSSTAPNPYDYHYNYNYMNQLLDSGITYIDRKIKDVKINKNNKKAHFDYDNSSFITESLPTELRYNIISTNSANIEFIRLTTDTILCATINREHARINLDSSIIKGKKISFKSYKQSTPFYITISGYKKDKLRYSKPELILPGKVYNFTIEYDNPSIIFASTEGGCNKQNKKYKYINKKLYEINSGKLRVLSEQEIANRLADFKANITLL